jgi:hypothetical protein
MTESDAAGAVRETYHAAVQHDLVDLPADAHLVGVVRRPTGWFRGTVDENRPALGPPETLLDAVKTRQEDLAVQGLCDEEAHNAAWDAVDFAPRYREYVEASDDAQAALEVLAERVRDGETVVLVCFEGESKHCHRHALVEMLQSRLSA